MASHPFAELGLAEFGLAEWGLAELQIPGGVRSAPMLKAVLAHVEDNLTASTLSPQTVAVDLRISKRYIHKLFAATSVTFAEHVTRRRLDHIAEQLLVQPLRGVPIAILAASYGFKDVSTFNRAFKRRYKMSPSAYRSQLRKTGTAGTTIVLGATPLHASTSAPERTHIAAQIDNHVQIEIAEPEVLPHPGN